MSAEKNKAFIRRYFEAISGKAKTPELLRQFIDDEKLIKHIGITEKGFPKYELFPEDMVAEGDKVVVRFSSHSIHNGEFMGVPPTGKEYHGAGIIIYRVQNEKIVEHWIQYDSMAVMEIMLDKLLEKKVREKQLEREEKIEGAHSKTEAIQRMLQAAQNRLIQREKFASLGALTAGIAHEIRNPLNFINNFSSLSAELIDEAQEILSNLKERTNAEEIKILEENLLNVQFNIEKIIRYGNRADGIVRSMQEHARLGKGERQVVDLNALLKGYVSLALNSLQVRQPGFEVNLEQDLDERIRKIELFPQEFGHVLMNLLDNAFYAVYQKASAGGADYTPTVIVRTKLLNEHVEIRVEDNGPGVPETFRSRIFEPFFTTKPAGEGTGLGLSLSHDIITQGHGGSLFLDSTQHQGAAFVIRIPQSIPSLVGQSD